MKLLRLIPEHYDLGDKGLKLKMTRLTKHFISNSVACLSITERVALLGGEFLSVRCGPLRPYVAGPIVVCYPAEPFTSASIVSN